MNWKSAIIGKKGFESVIGVLDTRRMVQGLPRLTADEIKMEQDRVDKQNAAVREMIKNGSSA